ncbi:MAG: hypothetical protein HZY76_10725 [Anaerolineae bacterium]|nr:MAG: hypothetical protein HZY76_10725 [Anaerolineae bacterium]
MLANGADADQLSHAPEMFDWEVTEALAQLDAADEPRPRGGDWLGCTDAGGPDRD